MAAPVPVPGAAHASLSACLADVYGGLKDHFDRFASQACFTLVDTRRGWHLRGRLVSAFAFEDCAGRCFLARRAVLPPLPTAQSEAAEDPGGTLRAGSDDSAAPPSPRVLLAHACEAGRLAAHFPVADLGGLVEALRAADDALALPAPIAVARPDIVALPSDAALRQCEALAVAFEQFVQQWTGWAVDVRGLRHVALPPLQCSAYVHQERDGEYVLLEGSALSPEGAGAEATGRDGLRCEEGILQASVALPRWAAVCRAVTGAAEGRCPRRRCPPVGRPLANARRLAALRSAAASLAARAAPNTVVVVAAAAALESVSGSSPASSPMSPGSSASSSANLSGLWRRSPTPRQWSRSPVGDGLPSEDLAAIPEAGQTVEVDVERWRYLVALEEAVGGLRHGYERRCQALEAECRRLQQQSASPAPPSHAPGASTTQQEGPPAEGGAGPSREAPPPATAAAAPLGEPESAEVRELQQRLSDAERRLAEEVHAAQSRIAQLEAAHAAELQQQAARFEADKRRCQQLYGHLLVKVQQQLWLSPEPSTGKPRSPSSGFVLSPRIVDSDSCGGPDPWNAPNDAWGRPSPLDDLPHTPPHGPLRSVGPHTADTPGKASDGTEYESCGEDSTTSGPLGSCLTA